MFCKFDLIYLSNKKRMDLKNSANGSKIDLLASESLLMQEMVGSHNNVMVKSLRRV